MKLYHYWRSSSSWRVRFGFAVKGIAAELVHVSLLNGESESPEHLKRNPFGYVPVLEYAPGKYLAESIAILEWANETQKGPSLLPSDPMLRARCRQLVETINAGTQPLVNPNAASRHSADAGEQKAWNQYWIKRGMEAFEATARETAGKFSVGDTITLADLCLVPHCYSAQRNDVTLEAYPTIARVHAALLETEACRTSHPERFKPSDA